jgi:2,3-bisphosphoglycerate-independent phosphoglycerate mutase
MTNFLFIFLDGVGLGPDDASTNPFARAQMPVLQELLGGQRLLADVAPLEGERLSLLELDAGLGIAGVPQSATGQATLLTGVNVPAEVGYHYGPKPNAAVAEFLRNGNLFNTFKKAGRQAALLNAYPPGYFKAIESGRRLYSAIPLAVNSAGIALKNAIDLANGQALSADFTSQGWRENLGFVDAPLLTPQKAGERLAHLGQALDFAFFEYWLSDYAGHHQDMDQALHLLELFDGVLQGLLESWDDSQGLVLITSDHGNMEDMSTRRHTLNAVPALVVGSAELRRRFTRNLHNLADVAPAITELILNPR